MAVVACFNGDVRTSRKGPADHESHYKKHLSRHIFVVYTQRKTSANCFTTVFHFLHLAKVKSMSPHTRTRESIEHTSCLLKLSHQYLRIKGQNTACVCSKDVCVHCLSHNIKTQITHICISIRRLVYVWIFVLITQRLKNTLNTSTTFFTSSNVYTMTEIEQIFCTLLPII